MAIRRIVQVLTWTIFFR